MMKKLLKDLRRYEIKIRKVLNSHMQGDFHSVFKGSGLEFDDVRQYQYGDDTRHIDWNVSAKGQGTFLKTFKEEKEQSVFFVVDVSASQEIGQKTQQKIDKAKEIAGVLMLSSMRETSSTGLLCYSDQEEKFIKPYKGPKHGYYMIKELFDLQPTSKKTNLGDALKFTLTYLKRKSLIFVISDFIDEGYEKNLKAMANRHDLVVIHLSDLRESHFPSIGIAPIFDKELGKTIWVNTSSSTFKAKTDKYFDQNKENLENLCNRLNANYMWTHTKEDYIPKLIHLFAYRNKIRK